MSKKQPKNVGLVGVLSQVVLLFAMIAIMAPATIKMAHAETFINLDWIMQIESSGNAQAYNAKSGATGLYQITPICLEDFNDYHEIKYRLSDMYDPQKSARVADWYMNTRIPGLLEAYGIEDTVDNRLASYHAGIGNLRKNKLGPATRKYISDYHDLTRGVK